MTLSLRALLNKYSSWFINKYLKQTIIWFNNRIITKSFSLMIVVQKTWSVTFLFFKIKMQYLYLILQSTPLFLVQTVLLLPDLDSVSLQITVGDGTEWFPWTPYLSLLYRLKQQKYCTIWSNIQSSNCTGCFEIVLTLALCQYIGSALGQARAMASRSSLP